MTKVTPISQRKSDHIRINLNENVQSGIQTGFDRFRFDHQALPELNLDEVDLSVSLFGKTLLSPLLISSMTGGTPEAALINQNLAIAAQEHRIALGLGSQRVALDHPEMAQTFRVRKWAPDILLFANLGAIQLNYGYQVEHCQKAVDMIEADALILHLNPLQEALQPDGDTNFVGLLEKIEQICKFLSVPVIVKEVGWGIGGETAKKLAQVGVNAIDVAGAGGTSWSQVEMHRARTPGQARLAAAFIDWGIPTAECIRQIHTSLPHMKIFASGGIRSGIDIAKSIALGASIGGIANIFLKAASLSTDHVIQEISSIQQEIKVVMFASGNKNIADLQQSKLIEKT